MTEEKISMYYRDGRSDKFYHAQIASTDGGFVVNYQHGRRGSTPQVGSKTPGPVSYETAKKVYDKLVSEKKKKGYTEGQDGTPYQGSEQAGTRSGLSPQLSNPIDEKTVEKLIADDDWHMQEKKDGCRLLIRKSGNAVEGINRKGAFIGISKAIEEAVGQLGGQCVLDGEVIGDVYWAFDVLELDGEDLSTYGVEARFNELNVLLEDLPQNGALRVVPFASTAYTKRMFFARLKADRAEGVVFKKRDAKYVPGRPNSGGSSLKYKFTATATCRVLGQNAGKRSVRLAVGQSRSGQDLEIGNVTIPPNTLMPAMGSLVEIEYLYAFPGGSLYQPVYRWQRTDVDRADQVESLKLKQSEGEEESDGE